MGCEYQSGSSTGAATLFIIVNLNALKLTSPPNSGSDGIYDLPSSAIQIFNTNNSNAPFDNIMVESNSHTVVAGMGGLWSVGNQFIIGTLQNPATSFGWSSKPITITMPNYSSSNTAVCSQPGCATSASVAGTQWVGWGDPHANGAFYNKSSSEAEALWENNNQEFIAVLKLGDILNNNSCINATSSPCIWYQGIP